MEILLEYAPFAWSAIFVITLIINLKVKDIDALWFTIGSAVTLIFSLIFRKLSVIYHLIVFVSVTIIPLLTLSKFIKRQNKLKSLQKSSDALIGKKIIVVEDCNEFNKGSGTIDNTIWNIICQPGYSLKKGDEAIIVAIDKHNLIVKQAE
jgi:membrane protein implicated in regulation of membrane protease activity